MAEVTGQQEEGRFASEIPSHNLPPVEYRDLPEPVKLRNIVGASVIILATALGSGEYVLWPFITSQVGLVFMWAAIVGFLIQFFINMEVERYTLATGETAITGFARLWKSWWWLFIVMALLQNFWPGWATGSATTLTFVLGTGEGVIVPITITALIAIGIALTISPVVYQTVEKVQFVLVGLIVIFLAVAIALATTAQAWSDLVTGFSNVGQIPLGQGTGEGLGIALLLGALAFAGAGGANNLVQSNYIRDKGMGMGQRIPRIVSPVTGEEEAAPATGYMFPQDEENLRRWRGWWKIANQEQFITFFLLGVISLIVLSVLTYSTVPVGEITRGEFEFIRIEGETLQDRIAPWFGIAFWLTGTIVLFSTNLGIIDYTCRLVADQMKINLLRESAFWSESKLYASFVWVMIAFGSLILLSGVQQPLVLLVISSSIAGVMMFIYSILLIALNRKALPHEIKIRGVRLGVMVVSVLFFGFFSVLLVWDQIQSNFLGG